jgi:hypothetical protein
MNARTTSQERGDGDPHDVTHAFSCRCGVRYVASAFAKLAPVRRLEATEIAPLVVRWPDDTVVDVRACAGCASPIARLVRGGTRRE